MRGSYAGVRLGSVQPGFPTDALQGAGSVALRTAGGQHSPSAAAGLDPGRDRSLVSPGLAAQHRGRARRSRPLGRALQDSGDLGQEVSAPVREGTQLRNRGGLLVGAMDNGLGNSVGAVRSHSSCPGAVRGARDKDAGSGLHSRTLC